MRTRAVGGGRYRGSASARRGRLQAWLDRIAQSDQSGSSQLTNDHLSEALDLQELTLDYQLVVTNSGVPAGAKALLRWQRQGYGLLEADSFLHAATDPELLRRLADFVAGEIAEALPVLRSTMHVAEPYIAISASAAQLEDRMFSSRLAVTLDAYGTDASGLAVEFTDPSGTTDWDAIADSTDELARLGVTVVVGDTGSEPGDLIYLERSHAGMVRIDRSLVTQSRSWDHERAVIEATVGLCRESGIRTIAQGVEDEATQTWLRELGADFLTGFAIAETEPLESFLDRFDPDVSPSRGLRRTKAPLIDD